MKKLLEEFKEFINKGNVMDLAVAVIIGGAFTAIVTSLTDDIINPLISMIGGSPDVKGMAITFNGFNARTSHINPFEGLGRNKNFLIVMFAIFAMQFVFVTFGGEVLSVEALSPASWLICIVLAFLVIPIDMIRKALMHKSDT